MATHFDPNRRNIGNEESQSKPKVFETRYRARIMAIASSCFFFSFGCASMAYGVHQGFAERKIFAYIGGGFYLISFASFYEWAKMKCCPQQKNFMDRFFEML